MEKPKKIILDTDDLHRPLIECEDMFAYSLSTQLSLQSGLIGHLRADYGSSGNLFFSEWFDFDKSKKTDEFKSEFDAVINALREEGDVLHNRFAMMKYCYSHPGSKLSNSDTSYGIRVDSEKYAYIIRLNPNKGEYNIYAYCYEKEWLDRYLEASKGGIRFIDSRYVNKFRLVNGGYVIVSEADGTKKKCIAYYVDDYHVEINGHIFHICQYGEMLERAGATVAPADEKMIVKGSVL